jgi:Trm5-related predicted tRNA methylase
MNDKQKKALEGYNHFISLRSHNLELATFADLINRRAEIIQKYNYTDELNKLKMAIDTRTSNFIRLNSELEVMLKKLIDLGINDRSDELKKIIALNKESITSGSNYLKNLSIIK